MRWCAFNETALSSFCSAVFVLLLPWFHFRAPYNGNWLLNVDYISWMRPFCHGSFRVGEGEKCVCVPSSPFSETFSLSLFPAHCCPQILCMRCLSFGLIELSTAWFDFIVYTLHSKWIRTATVSLDLMHSAVLWPRYAPSPAPRCRMQRQTLWTGKNWPCNSKRWFPPAKYTSYAMMTEMLGHNARRVRLVKWPNVCDTIYFQFVMHFGHFMSIFEQFHQILAFRPPSRRLSASFNARYACLERSSYQITLLQHNNLLRCEPKT